MRESSTDSDTVTDTDPVCVCGLCAAAAVETFRLQDTRVIEENT